MTNNRIAFGFLGVIFLLLATLFFITSPLAVGGGGEADGFWMVLILSGILFLLGLLSLIKFAFNMPVFTSKSSKINNFQKRVDPPPSNRRVIEGIAMFFAVFIILFGLLYYLLHV